MAGMGQLCTHILDEKTDTGVSRVKADWNRAVCTHNLDDRIEAVSKVKNG